MRSQRLSRNSTATQTVSPPQVSTAVGADADLPGIYFSEMGMLKATVRAELANVLKMPKSLTSSMKIELNFKAIPFSAMVRLFSGAETHTSPEGNVMVGLIRCMELLNDSMHMEEVLQNGMGCCKLVVPESALVGRSVLSFAPTWQIWSKASESGALETIISGFLVILDESGEMRTPPDHTCVPPPSPQPPSQRSSDPPDRGWPDVEACARTCVAPSVFVCACTVPARAVSL